MNRGVISEDYLGYHVFSHIAIEDVVSVSVSGCSGGILLRLLFETR